MPAKWEPGSEHLELRDEFRSGTLVLRRYYDSREPPERRQGWQLNRQTPEGEKLVLRGEGHDMEAIKDVLHRETQEHEPHEKDVREAKSISDTRPRKDVRSLSKSANGKPHFVAGRVVDYNAETDYAVFSVRYRSTSKHAVGNYLEHHPGMLAYYSPFPERPKLGALIEVPRGFQPVIDRAINELELTREEGRTFIVARYTGKLLDPPTEVTFLERRQISRGEERIAIRPGSSPSSKATKSRSLYLVIERDPNRPRAGKVVGCYNAMPPARVKARELEAQLVQKQEPSQSPRSKPEWWKREAKALRERRGQQRTPPNEP